jgi:hypothetical protein
MDVSGYNRSGSITVNRPPADVYAIVSDVTRMGELSPVCQSCAWDDADQAGQEGAWFTGHNAIGDYTWDTSCRVAVAAPAREFTFVNYGPADRKVELVRWGYTFEADGDGTKVIETWQLLPAYPDFVREGDPKRDVKARIDGMAQMAQDGITDTLANLKRVAES